MHARVGSKLPVIENISVHPKEGLEEGGRTGTVGEGEGRGKGR